MHTSEVKPESTRIAIRGKGIYVPSLKINECTIVSTGRFLKVAHLFDEELIERDVLPDPYEVIAHLRQSSLGSDLFLFSQRPLETSLHYPFHKDWDNLAVAPTTSFQTWWGALPQESRKNARQSEKRGVVVKCMPFDDALAHGIKRIYDETPFRQGRQFWHYGKSFELVRKENSTYSDRSFYICAYLNDDLIGFLKLVRVDRVATVVQILAMVEHRDKKPMNALLKHAMEICEQQNFESLVYGSYHYGTNNDSSLTEFKRRNGFVEVKFPRYTVPLNCKGKFAIALGLHLGWRNLIPLSLRSLLVKTRGKILKTRRPSPVKADGARLS